MILLISFLSIGIYVIFFVCFYKAIKLAKQHLGLGYALGLIIGLFTLLSNTNPIPVNHKPDQYVLFNDTTGLRDFHNTEFIIEEKTAHRIVLNLSVGREKATNRLVATSASAYMNGMHIGTQWQPSSILLFPVPGTDSVRYNMDAKTSNRILIFSNAGHETYSGTIALH